MTFASGLTTRLTNSRRFASESFSNSTARTGPSRCAAMPMSCCFVPFPRLCLTPFLNRGATPKNLSSSSTVPLSNCTQTYQRDRKRVGGGKGVAVRGYLGGRRSNKKKKNKKYEVA